MPAICMTACVGQTLTPWVEGKDFSFVWLLALLFLLEAFGGLGVCVDA